MFVSRSSTVLWLHNMIICEWTNLNKFSIIFFRRKSFRCRIRLEKQIESLRGYDDVQIMRVVPVVPVMQLTPTHSICSSLPLGHFGSNKECAQCAWSMNLPATIWYYNTLRLYSLTWPPTPHPMQHEKCRIFQFSEPTAMGVCEALYYWVRERFITFSLIWYVPYTAYAPWNTHIQWYLHKYDDTMCLFARCALRAISIIWNDRTILPLCTLLFSSFHGFFYYFSWLKRTYCHIAYPLTSFVISHITRQC